MKIFKFLLIAALMFTFHVGILRAEPQFSGKITRVEGEVTVKADEKSEWSKAEAGMDLNEGAFVMTAFESACDIEFCDKSAMKIKELSKIQISKFSAGLKKVDAQVTLYNGKVRATVAHEVDKDTQFKVKTAVSTISVRGTEKEITFQPGFGADVHNITGIVEVTNLIGQKNVILRGETTKVAAGDRKPDTVSEEFKQKSRKAMIKNTSLTLSEQETAQEFSSPKFNLEQARLQDIMEIMEERKIHPTTVISVNW